MFPWAPWGIATLLSANLSGRDVPDCSVVSWRWIASALDVFTLKEDKQLPSKKPIFGETYFQ